jgi:hypothetical protein
MAEGTTKFETRLDTWQKLATILSLIAVPVFVAISGALIQQSVKNSEARTKTMELAIQILKEPPGRSDQSGLRTWAIEMLQASSNIPLSDEARRELQASPVLAVRQLQRRVSRGGVIFLIKDKTEQIEDHLVTLLEISKDSVTVSFDSDIKAMTINDSVDAGCIYHLLGLGYRKTHWDANRGGASLEDERTQPTNAAFIAYVCPWAPNSSHG